MSTDTFYGTAAQLCFALLGFWWVVVQFRHAEFTSDTTRRRFALLVSLYFILPGIVSLASLISANTPLWRVAFVRTGITGLATAVAAARITAPAGALRSVARGSWIAAPVFAFQILFAVAPDLARNGLQMAPLEVEGYLLGLVLLLGLAFAWLFLAEPVPPS